MSKENKIVFTWRGYADEEGFARFATMEDAKHFVQNIFYLDNEAFEVLRSTGEWIEGDKVSADGGLSLTLAIEN